MDPLTIIGGALSIGGALYGGISSATAANKAREEKARQRRRNRAWYEYDMATPYTQRADALASVQKAREIFMERNKNASATAAVSGATDEAAARMKEDSNKAIADTMSNIAAQGAVLREEQQERYREREDRLAEQMAQDEKEKAQAIAGATTQVMKAGANMMGGVAKDSTQTGDTKVVASDKGTVAAAPAQQEPGNQPSTESERPGASEGGTAETQPEAEEDQYGKKAK